MLQFLITYRLKVIPVYRIQRRLVLVQKVPPALQWIWQYVMVDYGIQPCAYADLNRHWCLFGKPFKAIAPYTAWQENVFNVFF